MNDHEHDSESAVAYVAPDELVYSTYDDAGCENPDLVITRLNDVFAFVFMRCDDRHGRKARARSRLEVRCKPIPSILWDS